MMPNDFIVQQIQKLQGGDSGFFREINSVPQQTSQPQQFRAGSKTKPSKKKKRSIM